MKDLEELKKELENLTEQRARKAEELRKAQERTKGPLTDPSNRNFAARIAEELSRLDRLIAAKEAEIEKIGKS